MAITPLATWMLLRGPSPESVAVTFTAPMSAARTEPARFIPVSLPSIAVSLTGDAVVYVRALAEFEFDSGHRIKPAVMAANGGSLAGRIARLLGQSSTSGRASGGTATAPALILLAIGALAVFAQPVARPQFEVPQSSHPPARGS